MRHVYSTCIIQIGQRDAKSSVACYTSYMKLSKLLLIALISVGCANTYDLEEKWAPLEQIVERPGNDLWMTTIGKHIYLSDLDAWLERNPPDSIRFNSHLSHEHVHSIRQHQEGVTSFLAKYLTDQDFRWKEEQLGWYVSIKLYRRNGWLAYPENIADSLASYRPKLGEREDLLKWVQDVISDRWKPAPGDLPEQYKDL